LIAVFKQHNVSKDALTTWCCIWADKVVDTKLATKRSLGRFDERVAEPQQTDEVPQPRDQKDVKEHLQKSTPFDGLKVKSAGAATPEPTIKLNYRRRGC